MTVYAPTPQKPVIIVIELRFLTEHVSLTELYRFHRVENSAQQLVDMS
jgi:hypothetical protein